MTKGRSLGHWLTPCRSKFSLASGPSLYSAFMVLSLTIQRCQNQKKETENETAHHKERDQGRKELPPQLRPDPPYHSGNEHQRGSFPWCAYWRQLEL